MRVSTRRFGKPVGLLLLGLALGYLAGIGSPSVAVWSDVTEGPQRESFKAGSVLNEPVLREISATLKRIESRVEKIEKNTAASSTSKPASATSKPK